MNNVALVLRDDAWYVGETNEYRDILYLDKNGVELPFDGWTPEVAALAGDNLAGDVSEAPRLNLVGSLSDIEGLKQRIGAFVGHAQASHDPKNRLGVWIRKGRRQAFLKALRHSPAGPAMPCSEGWEAPRTLAFTRSPFWEEAKADWSGVANLTIAATNCADGTFTVPVVYGDVDARLYYLLIQAGVVTGHIVDGWIGLRSDRWGTAANFVSLWECESGTNGTDAADEADAGAHGAGDNCVKVTFATVATMATRLTMTVGTYAPANYADQRGTFEIVARMKVDSGVTCNVRMQSGLGSSMRVYDPVSVTGTSFRLYSLGRVSFPPTEYGYLSLDQSILDSAIKLDAERTAGADGLHLDYIRLVPTEGFARFASAYVSATGGLILLNRPNERVEAVRTESTYNVATTPGTSFRSMVVPRSHYGAAGVGVLLAQDATVHYLTDTLTLGGKYFQRWLEPEE